MLLSAYITAINELVKDESEQSLTGILLCKNKDDFEEEFAPKCVNKPIGVSEYRCKDLPENIRENLTTLKTLAAELKNLTQDEE